MLESLQISSLLLTADALGGFEKSGETEGRVYVKGDECIECLGDLVRAIKNDEDDNAVLHQLAEWQIVEKDLVHILLRYTQDENLFRSVLRLLVYLTNPIDLNAADRVGHLINLQRHKDSLLDPDVFGVVIKSLVAALSTPHDDRRDADTEIIINTLHLLRNLAHVPDRLTTVSAHGKHKMRLQDTLIARCAEFDVFFLLNVACGNLEDRESLDGERIGHSVLEMIYLLFLRTTPEELVVAHEERTMPEAAAAHTRSDLSAALAADVVRKSRNSALVASTRHGRFGGSYTVRTDGGEDIPFRRNFTRLQHYSRDYAKRDKIKPQHKRKAIKNVAIKVGELSGPSNASLAVFMMEFLESGYNALMTYFHHEIESGRNNYAGDHSHLLWLTHFALRFGALLAKDEAEAHPDDPAEAVQRLGVFEMLGASLDLSAVKFAIQRMQMYREEKDYTRQYFALKAVKETLFAIDVMSSCGGKLRTVAESFQRKLYYEQLLETELISALVHYTGNSRPFIEDVVLSIHVHLRLLERYSKTRPSIMVQVRRRTPKRPSRPKLAAETERAGEDEDERGRKDEVDEQDEEESELRVETVEASEAEVRHVAVDRRLTFDACLLRFSHERCLRQYVDLLVSYATNERELNHAIIKFMYRLYGVPAVRPLFFKVSTLAVFHASVLPVLVPENEDDAAARRLVIAILRAFFKRWDELPTLYFEALFAKSDANVRYVHSGETADMSLNASVDKTGDSDPHADPVGVDDYEPAEARAFEGDDERPLAGSDSDSDDEPAWTERTERTEQTEQTEQTERFGSQALSQSSDPSGSLLPAGALLPADDDSDDDAASRAASVTRVAVAPAAQATPGPSKEARKRAREERRAHKAKWQSTASSSSSSISSVSSVSSSPSRAATEDDSDLESDAGPAKLARNSDDAESADDAAGGKSSKAESKRQEAARRREQAMALLRRRRELNQPLDLSQSQERSQPGPAAAPVQPSSPAAHSPVASPRSPKRTSPSAAQADDSDADEEERLSIATSKRAKRRVVDDDDDDGDE